MKIHTIGGYEKVGSNMTAVEVDGEIVIFDMGADIERVVDHDEAIEEMRTVEAIESKVVPDDSRIKARREDVVAIVIGHGHQDHTRGVPKLAGVYDCPIVATPYTGDIIERFIEDDDENVNNRIIRMKAGETFDISENLELDFIPITHSIPQSVLSVLRTREGTVVYSLDFKLDEEPTLGDPVDYGRIEEVGDGNIRAYIVDCTRIDKPGRTKTELETKKELEGILSEAYKEKEGVVVTTFSSHIARLNNIIDANGGERDIVMLGRSLKEYTKDAEKRGLINLSGIEVVSYREEVEETLKRVAKNKSEYLLITTGNQGEPNAILSRLGDEKYPYQLRDRDLVIFSSVTIPTPTNEVNREHLERKLQKGGSELKLDVHSHGHATREDHRDMMQMLDPEVVIPAHGGKDKLSYCASLAREEGVDEVRISHNGGTVSLD